TGTIGDASAGLWLSKRNAAALPEAARDYLVARYRVPQPRQAFGKSLRNFATAAIDVSDGLIADLSHIAEVSQVRIEIDSVAVPLSAELRALWGGEKETIARAASAGDDYEIAFTAPSSATPNIEAASRSASTPVTRIGRVLHGSGTALLDSSGREIPLSHKGYTHF